LQSKITQSVSNAFTTYGVAGQVGLEFNRDGTLTLDETKFRTALNDNTTSVAALFLGDGTELDEGVGVLTNTFSALDGITDSLTGPIHNATDGFNQSIRALNDMISSYQDRLDKEKDMLTAEFNAADNALKLLKVNQASLTSQLDSLSSS
jgi:flagellar hook-associated protein 2